MAIRGLLAARVTKVIASDPSPWDDFVLAGVQPIEKQGEGLRIVFLQMGFIGSRFFENAVEHPFEVRRLAAEDFFADKEHRARVDFIVAADNSYHSGLISIEDLLEYAKYSLAVLRVPDRISVSG